MNSKNLFRPLMALAALSVLSGVVAMPVIAQGKKPVAKTKPKVASAKKYECQHCKEPMTVAEAKKKGMQCCGMKMVEVKTSKKPDPKKKG